MKLLAALALTAAAVLAADDPGGWTAAKWGMSPDQVRAAVPESKPTRYEFDKGEFATLHVPELRIGDGPAWTVYFVFGSGDKLARVELCPAVKANATEQEFARVDSLLEQKYSRPFERQAGDSRASWPTIRRAMWTAGQTTLTLVHTDLRPRVQMQTLWLTYAPKQTAPL